MDHQRFDAITRAMAGGASRRRVLKGLAGGALGGLVALVGIGDAILSTVPAGYERFSVTSVAGPHGAGGAALSKASHLNLPPAQVKQTFRASRERYAIPEDPDTFGEGVLDVRR